MNWTHQGKEVKSTEDMPEGVIGFIYQITDLDNNKRYIGKKSLYSIRRPEIAKSTYDKLRKEGAEVKRTKNKTKSTKTKIFWRYKRVDRGETNWLSYTGSNVELNKKIKSGIKYKKEIIKYCYTKKQLTFYEMKEQFCNDVLENQDLYYNGNISAKFFPKDLHSK